MPMHHLSRPEHTTPRLITASCWVLTAAAAKSYSSQEPGFRREAPWSTHLPMTPGPAPYQCQSSCSSDTCYLHSHLPQETKVLDTGPNFLSKSSLVSVLLTTCCQMVNNPGGWSQIDSGREEWCLSHITSTSRGQLACWTPPTHTPRGHRSTTQRSPRLQFICEVSMGKDTEKRG